MIGASHTSRPLSSAAASRSVPQPPQNVSPGLLEKPHLKHSMSSGSPHSAQKRRAWRFSAWHLAHRMIRLPIGWVNARKRPKKMLRLGRARLQALRKTGRIRVKVARQNLYGLFQLRLAANVPHMNRIRQTLTCVTRHGSSSFHSKAEPQVNVGND